MCKSLTVYAGLVQPCLRHLEQEIAMHGSHGNATSLQRPNSDLPLAVSYSSSSLQHIKSCGTARLKILKAMSSHSTSSAQVWKAVHEYIKSHMPACRSQDHQGTAGSAVSAAHLQLIHEVWVGCDWPYPLCFLHGLHSRRT